MEEEKSSEEKDHEAFLRFQLDLEFI